MPPSLSELRLLILEDEPLIGLDISQTLEQAGAAQIALAGTVGAARRHLAEAPPHIALLDIVVPDGPPFDLLLTAGAAIIFVTGSRYGIPADLAHWPVLEKPFTPDELMATILNAHKSASARRHR